MTLEGIYVIPHGDELVDNPSEGSIRLRKEIEKIASTDTSETLIIISPHGVRLKNRISVLNTEWLQADFKTERNFLTSKYRTDRETASKMVNELSGYTEEIQFITSSGELSSFPLDFGTVIPLSFFDKRKIVALGQTRTTDRNLLVNFGSDLSKLCETSNQKISIILSADQAHTHWEGGPYGYSEKAEEYDKIIRQTIDTSDFTAFLELTEDFIEDAKPDSYWNMLILHGILSQTARALKVRDYYVERYFGMLVAS